MMKRSSLHSLLVKACVPVVALFAFTQCSDVDLEQKPEAEEETVAVNGQQKDAVLSLTIDGVFTELISTADCETCDYVVPENATVVDGAKIGIKPGQAICLDEAIKYGNLRFVNMNGAENKPVRIAYFRAVSAHPEKETYME